MDTWSPAWGFAAVGGIGVLVTLAVLPGELRRRAASRARRVGTGQPTADPADVPSPDAVPVSKAA
jgi:hypothetical protein